MTTIFKKIIDKELPAEVVFENEHIIAFNDIDPKAPVHILILPKKEIPDINSVGQEDFPLIGEIVQVAQQLAKENGLSDYRLITNNGREAGQSVFHLHFHLLGGRQFGTLG